MIRALLVALFGAGLLGVTVAYAARRPELELASDAGPVPVQGFGEDPPLPRGDAPIPATVAPLISAFSLGAWSGSAWTLPDRAAPYAEIIAGAEQRYGLPQGLIGRVLAQESAYDPDVIAGRRTSSAGAVGIAQFMPSTARELGVDPLDPASAIPGAARYLRKLFDQFGTWTLALAAYNWGPGNLQRKGFGAAPEETRNYVRDISRDTGIG